MKYLCAAGTVSEAGQGTNYLGIDQSSITVDKSAVNLGHSTVSMVHSIVLDECTCNACELATALRSNEVFVCAAGTGFNHWKQAQGANCLHMGQNATNIGQSTGRQYGSKY